MHCHFQGCGAWTIQRRQRRGRSLQRRAAGQKALCLSPSGRAAATTCTATSWQSAWGALQAWKPTSSCSAYERHSCREPLYDFPASDYLQVTIWKCARARKDELHNEKPGESLDNTAGLEAHLLMQRIRASQLRCALYVPCWHDAAQIQGQTFGAARHLRPHAYFAH